MQDEENLFRSNAIRAVFLKLHMDAARRGFHRAVANFVARSLDLAGIGANGLIEQRRRRSFSAAIRSDHLREWNTHRIGHVRDVDNVGPIPTEQNWHISVEALFWAFGWASVLKGMASDE